MAQFFDYNPTRGTWYETEDAEDGKITVATKQDVEPVIDYCTRLRNSGYTDRGIKKGFWHYATIPAHVELELRQKGINIYNKGQTKELLKEINRNYPKLKCTTLKHE